MKRLYRLALREKKNVLILALSLVAALGFTISTQLEMFSLGLVAKRGPDLFELFGNDRDGQLTSRGEISEEELRSRFFEISQGRSVMTADDVNQFLEGKEREGLVDRGWAVLQRHLPTTTDIFSLILILVVVSITKAISLFWYRFGMKLFAIRISKTLREQYFGHLQTLPMSFYLKHNIGSLASRAVSDGYVIADGVNAMLVNYVQTPFALLSTLILCFSISWRLSCALFFGLPLVVIPIIFLARRIKRIAKQIQKKQESFSSILVECISGIQTIKLFSMEAFSMKKYREQNDQLTRLELRSARYDISARPVLHTAGMFCLITALVLGLWGLRLPLHEVLFFCGLLSAVYEPLKKFAEENGRIQRGSAACERMWEVLSLPPERLSEEEHGRANTIPFERKISFENVTFGYIEEKPVLRDISFDIPQGAMVAIVGATGSGKSTLISLLTNLFIPQAGEITVDQKPLSAFTQKALREFISVVPQRPFLFHESVMENIRFGQPYSELDVKRACEKAHADKFIQALPSGYHTVIGEAGKTLSGGQVQRLAIARALLKNSQVLILDEATSALDSVSEHQIKQVLKELKGSITLIVIAHRLSTIEEADSVIVLSDGAKLAQGPFHKLIETCPEFSMMCRLSGIEKITRPLPLQHTTKT